MTAVTMIREGTSRSHSPNQKVTHAHALPTQNTVIILLESMLKQRMDQTLRGQFFNIGTLGTRKIPHAPYIHHCQRRRKKPMLKRKIGPNRKGAISFSEPLGVRNTRGFITKTKAQAMSKETWNTNRKGNLSSPELSSIDFLPPGPRQGSSRLSGGHGSNKKP